MEREAWGEAAGGKGKLSEWIRATCNNMVFNVTRTGEPTPEILAALRADKSEAGGLPGTSDAEHPEPTEPQDSKPLIVKDIIASPILGSDASVGAYERHKAALERERQVGSSENEGGVQPTGASEPAALTPAPQPSATAGRPSPAKIKCSRESTHRTGVYCVACKKVQR